MKKLNLIILIFLSMITILSSQELDLIQQELLVKEYQVMVLKLSCLEQNIDTSFTRKADNMYNETLQIAENDHTQIFQNLDYAFILYRLALGIKDLEESNFRHSNQIESLKLARKQLEIAKQDLEKVTLELENEKN
ncbi:MAG: hypothetical protein JW996_01395 [Candidatus Cloacimonetes bacterium]|nr:hypothetical protein [Candidatus Cloacimonadota bacterium]